MDDRKDADGNRPFQCHFVGDAGEATMIWRAPAARKALPTLGRLNGHEASLEPQN
jgi:hypothetical protein